MQQQTKIKKPTVNRQIAWTHLNSKPGQTLVALLGVTFGVSMYIFMNSFMNGVNQAQDDLAFSTLAHVRIYNDDDKRSYNPAESFLGTEALLNIRNKKSLQYTDGIKNTSQVISHARKATRSHRNYAATQLQRVFPQRLEKNQRQHFGCRTSFGKPAFWHWQQSDCRKLEAA